MQDEDQENQSIVPQTMVPLDLYSAAIEKMQRIGHENSRLREVINRATSYYRNQTAHIEKQQVLMGQLSAEATFIQYELQSALAGESETCVGNGCQNPVVYHCSRLFCGAPLCKECAEYDLVPMAPNYYCPSCWKAWLKSLQDGKVGEAGALYAFMGWLTSRDAVSGPFSARHEAGAAAQLVGLYCEKQGWTITDDRWDRHIKPFPYDAPQGGTVEPSESEPAPCTLSVPRNFFEHLLACLDNQKFIHDVNADGLSEGIDEVRKTQDEMQQAIDEANRQARELLHNGVQPVWPEVIERNHVASMFEDSQS